MTENCNRVIVLGCGHTGTTLLSGILDVSGIGNIGFYTPENESPLFGHLNEILFERGPSARLNYLIDNYLDRLEEETEGNWCLKNPLLPFTYDAIYSRIKHPVKLILNYRNPGSTVNHLLKHRKRKGHRYSADGAQTSAELEWLIKNQKSCDILDSHDEDKILFLDYERLFQSEYRPILNRFIGKDLNFGSIQEHKNKSKPIPVNQVLEDLYSKIQEKAERNHSFIQKNNRLPEPDGVGKHRLQQFLYRAKRIGNQLLPHSLFMRAHGPSLLPYAKGPFPHHYDYNLCSQELIEGAQSSGLISETQKRTLMEASAAIEGASKLGTAETS
jgi:hypothetical protein